MRTFLISLAIAVLVASAAIAADTCNVPAACKEVQTCGAPDSCGRCGCRASCEKYCRVVSEMKEVKKTVWVVKCDDFCAPLPRCPLQCAEGCGSCGKEGCPAASCEGCGKSCDPCANLENRNYIPPKCGKVRNKKTLEKKEVVCKIPAYKCVVVYACANCGPNCGGEKTEPPAPSATSPAPTMPPAPPPPSKTTHDAPLPSIVSASFVK